ncbi:hypothetical protein BBOV_II004560 [Babesia bovis T2Bo]|uniref:KHDC4/BBP-like KH-domain type I domain-containing protein n=1 Tax=Babesia bovis TaxID=5865 RepID=A7AU00_BABBO|nr:hypothetical protein BBOV_II004560 [Babesia bovis T2Bo]EDO06411.1 hypothetical protein BBOV_II004560 [Babesia bovis T2Bo]|eukprot:XP_001609979.1 hypothetical protein [Babesia bovis T2Bo]
MAHHGYHSDNTRATHDSHGFPMMFPGHSGPHGPAMHQMHSNYMPGSAPSMAGPYPMSYTQYGNSSPGWRQKGSHDRTYGAPYRQPAPDARPRKGRPVRGQYGGAVRTALLLENAVDDYRFVDEDIRELFSNFGGISKLQIHPTLAVAEITHIDESGAMAAINELNALTIPGVGTLKCVELRSGQTIDSLIANMQPFDHRRHPKGYTANPYSDTRHGTAYSSPAPVYARVARLELVELFSFEPEFDVTTAILGPQNGNIEYIMRNSDGVVDIAIKGKPLNSAPPIDRLHVCLSSHDLNAYFKALHMLEDLLTSVCEKFVAFARGQGHHVPSSVGFRRHEYQGVNGNLEYLGVTDHPKSWLPKRRSNTPQHMLAPSHRPPYKRVNDRPRGGPHRSVGGPRFSYRSVNRANTALS